MSFVKDNFKMLYEIGECIAQQFGEECEVVLHDLTRSYDNTIVAIWNGHITGRVVGGGGTDAGLSILRGTALPKDKYNYINTTKEGRILRSSSKYFLDENGNAVGSLCINYDITELSRVQSILSKLTNSSENDSKEEVFTNSVDDLLDILMKEAVEQVGKSVELLDKEEKASVVRYLDDKGAFLIKKSVEKVADFLGVSRFTIYNYLNEAQEEAQ